MKNFRKEYTLADEELHLIKQEITRDTVDWGEPRTGAEDSHINQYAIYLNEVLPLPGETRYHQNTQNNPFVMKGRLHKEFPLTIQFLKRFSKKRGELCRIVIFNLNKGGEFRLHRDFGDYYKIRDRYHLVVISSGSFLQSGDEECIMQEGEVWWFNNKEPHQGRNMSAERNRIHVVFDILPKGTESLKEKMVRKTLNMTLLGNYHYKKYLKYLKSNPFF